MAFKASDRHSALILTLIPMCGFLPHTKQFLDTSWVSYSLTKF